MSLMQKDGSNMRAFLEPLRTLEELQKLEAQRSEERRVGKECS